MQLDADSSGGFVFDSPPFGQDGFAASEADVGWGQITDTFVLSAVVAVIDEVGDGCLKFVFEEVVFEQNAVFNGLVSPLDLAFGLRMHRSATHVFHALVLEAPGQIPRNIGRAIVAEGEVRMLHAAICQNSCRAALSGPFA